MNYFSLIKFVLSRGPQLPDFKNMKHQEIFEFCQAHVSVMRDILIFDRFNRGIPIVQPVSNILIFKYWKKKYSNSFNAIKAANAVDPYGSASALIEAEKINEELNK